MLFFNSRFKKTRWFPVYKMVHQWLKVISFKFVNNIYPHYLNEVHEYAPQCRIESRSNFVKLKIPFRKNNIGQKGLPYIGPSLWSNLPEFMKRTTVLNTFKHNLKKQYIGSLVGR